MKLDFSPQACQEFQISLNKWLRQMQEARQAFVGQLEDLLRQAQYEPLKNHTIELLRAMRHTPIDEGDTPMTRFLAQADGRENVLDSCRQWSRTIQEHLREVFGQFPLQQLELLPTAKFQVSSDTYGDISAGFQAYAEEIRELVGQFQAVWSNETNLILQIAARYVGETYLQLAVTAADTAAQQMEQYRKEFEEKLAAANQNAHAAADSARVASKSAALSAQPVPAGSIGNSPGSGSSKNSGPTEKRTDQDTNPPTDAEKRKACREAWEKAFPELAQIMAKQSGVVCLLFPTPQIFAETTGAYIAEYKAIQKSAGKAKAQNEKQRKTTAVSSAEKDLTNLLIARYNRAYQGLKTEYQCQNSFFENKDRNIQELHKFFVTGAALAGIASLLAGMTGAGVAAVALTTSLFTYGRDFTTVIDAFLPPGHHLPSRYVDQLNRIYPINNMEADAYRGHVLNMIRLERTGSASGKNSNYIYYPPLVQLLQDLSTKEEEEYEVSSGSRRKMEACFISCYLLLTENVPPPQWGTKEELTRFHSFFLSLTKLSLQCNFQDKALANRIQHYFKVYTEQWLEVLWGNCMLSSDYDPLNFLNTASLRQQTGGGK